MKAVIFHSIGDILLDEVPEPKIQHPGWINVEIVPGK